VRGNTWVNVASGLNWYLKYYAGVQLSWNGMTAALPAVLPAVTKKERHETDLRLRYDYNYCTFSYTMAFWDWERWEREIDWMALHGINIPLAAVGAECVWMNMLQKLGYSKDEINKFIAGPAFLAWWEMNNLEGWGGPNPDSWYRQQEALQKRILKRMREYGMHPVLPGYSGMVPSNAKEKLGLDVEGDGVWNGYRRPAFLMPTDARYNEIADLYYKEQKALYGISDYYSMDPFHESSAEGDIDFDAAGKAVMGAMKRVNPKATWVIQGWTENPREAMVKNMKQGDLLILDLFSECRPMWGIPSIWKRDNGYMHHNWLFCMLLNFGGNVGLHGRMDQLIDNFYLTKNNPLAENIKGIGLTMEGSENNPVMFEMMCELPWRGEKFTKEQWIREYVRARYGDIRHNNAEHSGWLEHIDRAWSILVDGIYNCPKGNNQQGAHESIFCSRPGLNNFQASSWSKMMNYYDPRSTEDAAREMLKAAESLRGNNNYEYDLVDIVRQAVADRARIVYQHIIADFKSYDKRAFKKDTATFLNLMLLQDQLLGTRREFRVGRWIEDARNLGTNKAEKDLYEWNARVQITTWGNRTCANKGKLHDYAHKEWNGLLKDFYYPRWEAFFKSLDKCMNRKFELPHGGNATTYEELKATLNKEQPSGLPEEIDFYAMEEPWTLRTEEYSSQPVGSPVDVAKEVFEKALNSE
ncbi:MAG: alpha-N-acetylglucosaminidase, partial [Bacteroidaceae bacterium]|nr:alpha-N-acetylglucosaminidase [Bacteroidaceae bacterium]